MPSLSDAVLVVEDDAESGLNDFARDLTSLLQVRDAGAIRGLVVGRFQRASGIDRVALERVLARQPVLAAVPILANVDIGHTFPLATLPIGGLIAVNATPTAPRITVTDR
jgi:muramoyltetrapeptide carboxypeptidase LdcA involved in peptidoglycan recycling